MGLEDLYQQLLLDHARSPQNRGSLPPPARESRVMNPVCGDEVVFTALVENDIVVSAKFAGHGCMISQAAASLLTDAVQGKTLVDARQIVKGFRALMRGEAGRGELGDLLALEGVKMFPIRIKCALLAFEAADKAFAEGVGE